MKRKMKEKPLPSKILASYIGNVLAPMGFTQCKAQGEIHHKPKPMLNMRQ
jgi:hypothetical protein